MSESSLQGELQTRNGSYAYYPVGEIEGADVLPIACKILIENILRNATSAEEALRQSRQVVEASSKKGNPGEISFMPARVLLQDFTGVPVFVDFATMREAFADLGGDPARINPQIPCDLVIDHSVIADSFGCADSQEVNEDREYVRNSERYEFLKWAQSAFQNVRIVPPGQGICHQLNIEQLASVVCTASEAVAEGVPSADASLASSSNASGAKLAYFDTVVGTDSHTTTANGIGVLGWGVGGIEAEAASLGQPISILAPEVIGMKLTGSLEDGVCAMDVALTFAEILRKRGVVGKFVECFGEGVSALSATQRSTISNMTPEYGCTCTYFPVDQKTIEFLRMTGKDESELELIEEYCKAQGAWGASTSAEDAYCEVIELDLGSVRPSMAGPSRPHERIPLADAKGRIEQIRRDRGLAGDSSVEIELDDMDYALGNGAIAIAAITSCTTATDPEMMLAAGLLAKKAVEAGLAPKPWVKTILAPGSHATRLLLERAHLLEPLEKLGYSICGFGCMSCIGNSGPIIEEMHQIADDIELASVLSGNRNFEGRISPDVAQNYLMSPAHVVAYSLVGKMDVDWENDPIGKDATGANVYLKDLEPSSEEVKSILDEVLDASLYEQASVDLFSGDSKWQGLDGSGGSLFEWNEESTYVRKAPYFEGMAREVSAASGIDDALALAVLGDFITTDHISPAGSIAPASDAASYLVGNGVSAEEFNTYGSRRGNHEVMQRGTFSNPRLNNAMAKGATGGMTYNMLEGKLSTIYEAACDYAAGGRPALVLAGEMYGSGSSRDWAAKGPLLLGIKAAIAQSFERIHRSNLIGMGILPLQFVDGQNAESLGLDGTEEYSIPAIEFSDGTPEEELVEVVAKKRDGSIVRFQVLVRIDTATEGEYYRNGGILQYVLRNMAGII